MSDMSTSANKTTTKTTSTGVAPALPHQKPKEKLKLEIIATQIACKLHRLWSPSGKVKQFGVLQRRRERQPRSLQTGTKDSFKSIPSSRFCFLPPRPPLPQQEPREVILPRRSRPGVRRTAGLSAVQRISNRITLSSFDAKMIQSGMDPKLPIQYSICYVSALNKVLQFRIEGSATGHSMEFDGNRNNANYQIQVLGERFSTMPSSKSQLA
mmetsp:Transcript_21506/g.42251  ORF Transcript_21506/g.42251 Transcript_21506/m.42251 type:complete len:211 (-) Transcript_21506:283-915(-)